MELPFLLLLWQVWGLSDPRIVELREMPRQILTSKVDPRTVRVNIILFIMAVDP